MKQVFLTVMFLIVPAVWAFADVHLYLFSTAQKTDQPLTINDIAMTEGSSADVEKIRHLIIPACLADDGYLDSREISGLLHKNGIENFTVQGTAVKTQKCKKADSITSSDRKTAVIRKGDTVKIIIKRKNLSLTTTGKAASSASAGNRVTVRSHGKTVSGSVCSDGTVMCSI